jgi:hypothetical protein
VSPERVLVVASKRALFGVVERLQLLEGPLGLLVAVPFV